jgi:hypothetical protein
VQGQVDSLPGGSSVRGETLRKLLIPGLSQGAGARLRQGPCARSQGQGAGTGRFAARRKFGQGRNLKEIADSRDSGGANRPARAVSGQGEALPRASRGAPCAQFQARGTSVRPRRGTSRRASTCSSVLEQRPDVLEPARVGLDGLSKAMVLAVGRRHGANRRSTGAAGPRQNGLRTSRIEGGPSRRWSDRPAPSGRVVEPVARFSKINACLNTYRFSVDNHRNL